MTAIGPKKKPHRPSLHENAGLSRLTPHSREIVIPVGHEILWAISLVVVGTAGSKTLFVSMAVTGILAVLVQVLVGYAAAIAPVGQRASHRLVIERHRDRYSCSAISRRCRC